ncbi:MAG: 50S ribosomal protein L28 [Lutispora sp.]|jgi:large subunit ribosomal protein L28|uniref:50S ribosomal protein L28 n=1 Tax=Lutispora sp. TaxID=2828727 RepID=UPI0035678E68
MARHCEVCGKGMISGNKVSHSMRHSRRVWRPNIRTVRAIVNGSSKRIHVCTRCLRSGKVERAI